MEPERTALVIQPRVSMLAFQYNLPKTMTVDQEFEANILAMRIQPDEENFEEAEAQAWRVWSEPAVSRSRFLVSLTTTHCDSLPSGPVRRPGFVLITPSFDLASPQRHVPRPSPNPRRVHQGPLRTGYYSNQRNAP